ncbi:transcriptional coactivator Hfi1/transcriptional adapter 1 [Tanacetum coccineum]
MQPPQQHSWMNLAEIKGQLVKKIGLERSKQYLDYLNRFLSLKLSKGEFDKLCLKTVGKDNIRLHNQLIRAVLRNACTRKVSPGVDNDSLQTVGSRKPLDGVYHQNGSHNAIVTPVTSPLGLTNGDILPPSPRKARSGPRERRVMDRKSALAPNGKTNFMSFSSSVPQLGDSASPDTRGVVHHQEPVKQVENADFVGVQRVEQAESLGRKDGKGVSVSDRISLHAPLGVPFCPVSIGGASRALPSGSSSKCVGDLHIDGLLETATLKEHMEQIATPYGLQQVSMDCANMMNRGLDVYLKGLIRSCTGVNGGGSVYEPTKGNSVNHPTHMKSLNGVRLGHHQIQSGGWPLHVMQEQEPKPKHLVTMLDFRVAMELNCKQLGEDWAILMEKISCTHDFEE